MRLVLAFLAAQGADAITWAAMDKAREANPLVAALGPDALWVKLAVVAFAAVVALMLDSHHAWSVVMAIGVVVGVIGSLSNLL